MTQAPTQSNKFPKERLRRELAKRARKAALAFKSESLFDPSFPQQKAFCDDPSKLKALWCTRRAAKSYTAGLYMVKEALDNPGSNVLFIGLTRISAKGIVWKDILREINKKFSLQARFNQVDLTMTFPNGSVIQVTGVDSDEAEMLKLLGKKYRLVCIDEASMYTIDTKTLIYGVLRPAMVDPDNEGERGTICMMGTSSNFPRGLFYDVTTGAEKGWSIHTWSAFDNPFVAKQWGEELEEIARVRASYMETPQFKQFYLNEWAVDDEKRVYKLDVARNLFSEIPKGLPPNGWTYVLGVDTGWEDDNAFVLCGYHANDPHLYVLKTYNKPHMTFDQVVSKIQEFMAESEFQPSKVVIDGANKQGVESMRVRSSIPFEYADKTAKVDFIEMLNGDLVTGKVLIHKSCITLINEAAGLVWKTDSDKIVYPKKEHPSLPNHLCDAMLYAWRNGFHYHSSPLEKTLAKGSKEWFEEQAKEIWEKERERLEREHNLANGWGSDSGWSSED